MSEKNSESVEESQKIEIFESIDSVNNVFTIAVKTVKLDRYQRLEFNEKGKAIPKGLPYYILRIPSRKSGLNIASLELLKELKQLLEKKDENLEDLRKKVSKVKSKEELKKTLKEMKEERMKGYFHLINNVISCFNEKGTISFTFSLVNLSKQEIVAIIDRMIVFEEN